MSEFAAHGDCQVAVEGQLLVTRVSGPWNLELVEQWTADVLAPALMLAEQGPWASMVVISKSMLSTPDAVAAIGRSIRQVIAQAHPAAIVYVIGPGVEGRGMMEGGLERMHRGLVPVKFFAAEDAARAWWAAQLAR